MSKKFIPWDMFSTPAEAVDLLKESVREGIKFDAFGGKTTFTALALTDSYKLTDAEASGYGDATAGITVGAGTKYKFKARIIDENSPHMFLPDPCSLAENEDKEQVVAAIERHTDFIQINAGNNAAKVSMGDIVEVQLNKNVFSYDLQSGKFNKILAHNSKAKSLLRSVGCYKLVKDFTKLPEIPTTSLTLSDVGGADVSISRKNKGVHILQPQKDFLVDFIYNLSQIQVEGSAPPRAVVQDVVVTDGFRSPTEQAKRLYAFYTDASKGEAYLRKLYSNSSFARSGSPNLNDVINEFNAGGGVEDVARLINEAFNQKPSRKVSKHQLSLGIDIRTRDLSTDQVRALAKACDAITGTTYLFEPLSGVWKNNKNSSVERIGKGGGEHLHINVPDSYENKTT